MSLTDSQIKKFLNKNHDKAFEVLDRDSLGVRVTLKGTVTWQYRFRFDGKADRVTLGHYPNLSLAEARKLAPKLKGWLVDGKNPKLMWKAEKNFNTQKSKYTLIKLVNEWFDEVAERDYKGSTYKNYESTIRKWIFNEPKRDRLNLNWVKSRLDIPFDDISSGQWMDYFDWICREGSPVTSSSVFKLLKTITTWGLKREKISSSKLLLFRVPDIGDYPTVGERTPSVYEIARLWLEIDKSKALIQTKTCLKLIILLGGRNTAVRTAKWNDFDFDRMIWTIPVPKGKKEKRRRGMEEDDISVQKPERHPIPGKVKELLDELRFIYGQNGYVFKGDGNSKSSITIHTINRFCARISSKLFSKYGISKIVPHDFRRSIETINVDDKPHLIPICEKILGHKLQGVMKHYNKAEHLNQQLEIYEFYWLMIKNEIDSIQQS